MNETDPRVRRTRKLLTDALVELLREKSFHAITVQDVADRATVNRGTFYAHFEDKLALLDYVVGGWFTDELCRAGLEGAPFNENNLRTFHSGCLPVGRDLTPMLDTKMQSVLVEFRERWLGDSSSGAPSPAAKLASWTIFGSAIDWARAGVPETLPVRVAEIEGFVLQGISALDGKAGGSTNNRGVPHGVR